MSFARQNILPLLSNLEKRFKQFVYILFFFTYSQSSWKIIGAICADISFMICFLIRAKLNKAFKLMSQNDSAVVMRKHNIRVILKACTAFHKGRLTIPLQTFSSLLFSLSLSLCFSLCFSELPSLCFSFSLSLCFFSEWSLCSLEHRRHTCQRSSARGQTWSRCTDTQKMPLTKAPTTRNINTVMQNCQERPKSCDSPNALQPTSISNTQKGKHADCSTTAQITNALQMSFKKVDFFECL